MIFEDAAPASPVESSSSSKRPAAAPKAAQTRKKLKTTDGGAQKGNAKEKKKAPAKKAPAKERPAKTTEKKRAAETKEEKRAPDEQKGAANRDDVEKLPWFSRMKPEARVVIGRIVAVTSKLDYSIVAETATDTTEPPAAIVVGIGRVTGRAMAMQWSSLGLRPLDISAADCRAWNPSTSSAHNRLMAKLMAETTIVACKPRKQYHMPVFGRLVDIDPSHRGGVVLQWFAGIEDVITLTTAAGVGLLLTNRQTVDVSEVLGVVDRVPANLVDMWRFNLYCLARDAQANHLAYSAALAKSGKSGRSPTERGVDGKRGEPEWLRGTSSTAIPLPPAGLLVVSQRLLTAALPHCRAPPKSKLAAKP